MFPETQRHVSEQVDRYTAEQREGTHLVERLVDMDDRRLEPERREHDPGDHREVQVRYESRRAGRALDPRRPRESPLRHDGDDVE